MAKRALPYVKWYPREFFEDPATETMTIAQEGAYRRLLDTMWIVSFDRSDFIGLPDDDAYLAKRSKMAPATWKRTRAVLFGGADPVLFVSEVDGLGRRVFNARLRREHQDAVGFIRDQSQKGSKSAESRRVGSTAVQPKKFPVEPTTNQPEPEPEPERESTPSSPNPVLGSEAAALADVWMMDFWEPVCAFWPKPKQGSARTAWEALVANRDFWEWVKAHGLAELVELFRSIHEDREGSAYPHSLIRNVLRDSNGTEYWRHHTPEARELEAAAGVVAPDYPACPADGCGRQIGPYDTHCYEHREENLRT